MDWAPPALIVIYLISLFAKQNRGKLEQIFRFSFLTLVVGYFFYYSWGGNQFGPRYYYEGFPFLVLESVYQMRALWNSKNKNIQKYLLGILLTLLPISAFLFNKQGTFTGEAYRERKSLYGLAESTIHHPSIVFIHGFLGKRLVLGEEDAVRNPPLLQGKILYAHDRGKENQKLMAYYPDRDFYLGTYDPEKNFPVLTPSNRIRSHDVR